MKGKKTIPPKPRKKTGPSGLTDRRLQRVKEFKILSNTDRNRYGKIGSRTWGDELLKFLADKRLTRSDITHWMEKESKVKELISEELWSPGIEPSTSRQNIRSSDSSVAGESSEHAILNQSSNQSPNPMSYLDRQPGKPGILEFASNCNPNFDSFGNSSFGNYPSTSQSTTPTGLYIGATVLQGPLLPHHSMPDNGIPVESDLKDISTCFEVLRILSKICKSHEILHDCQYIIIKLYRKLEKIQKKKIVPEIPNSEPRPFVVKEELDQNIYSEAGTGTGAQNFVEPMNWEGFVEPVGEIDLCSEIKQEDVEDPPICQIDDVFSLPSAEN